MESLAVVFLAREAEGVAPVERFFAAYGAWDAGAAHQLIVVLKGFPGGEAHGRHAALIAQYGATTISVEDERFDIGAYEVAADRVDAEYLYFMNTHSEPRASGWLSKPYRQLKGTGVGLVGATGSWESPSRNLWLQRRELSGHRWDWVPYGVHLGASCLRYPRFPNCHVRTNAFMIARRTWNSVRIGRLRTKASAHRFESGTNSLTRQIMRMGLRALVVGADSRAYEPAEWRESGTFRSHDQGNLLVADNQTRRYDAADQGTRERLSCFAWGECP